MVRAFALQWLSTFRENAGDPAGAIEAAESALDLISDDVGPWQRAMLHTQLFSLYEHVGDTASASRHAAEALPVLDRLGAVDDAVQVRAVLASVALIEGRRDDAAQMIDALEGHASRATPGEIISVVLGRAHLALVDGDIATGLRLHREAAGAWGQLNLPGAAGGTTPWTILGEAMALAAYAQYGAGDDGADLFTSLQANARHDLDTEHLYRDYPIAGMALAALGIWGLLKEAMPAEEAIRLLVLADRFAYNRFTPTMRWPVLSAHAERAVPGLVSRIEAEYGERRGADLLDEARAVLKRVT
jgi:tetratricopeptide (TPR) repeat protein